MVNRLIEPTSRPDPDRRRGRREPRRHRAAARHRLRHPAGRPVPAPDDRRERGHRAAAARLAEGAPARAGRRAARARRPRPGAVPRPLPAPALAAASASASGVARALAADPPVMLMDEPFGAVDPIVRERLQNEFLRLQEELAKTILFVTHDIDEAIKMGDLVAVMQVGGQLAQFGAARRDPGQPGVGVRGPVRRRRPRAQAAVAQPRRRPGAAPAGHGPRRRRRRRGPRAGARPIRSPTSCSSTRRPARSAGSARTTIPTDGRLDRVDGRVDVAAAQPPDDAQGRAVDAPRRGRPGRDRRRPPTARSSGS